MDPSSPTPPTPAPAKYEYWAKAASTEIGGNLVDRVQSYASAGIVKEMTGRYARAYSYYYGIDPSGVHATSMVLRKGEQDELAAVRVNHSRALVRTLNNIVTASKAVWVPKAINLDHQSIKDCELAAAVLEFYFSELEINRIATRGLEEALVFSEGFIHEEWDENAGEDVVADPESNEITKSGDLAYTNVSAWDVIRPSGKASWEEVDWIIVRRFRNRYDLMAKYPEYADQIYGAGNGDTDLSARPPQDENQTDDVPVFHFYHKRTPALPTGRETVFLDNRCVLADGELDSEKLPVYRVCATDLFGTPYAYTTYLDILGIQELMDSIHTSIATNISTFGTQLIAIPKGSNIDPDDLAGGMKAVYYENDQKPPQAIQLTASPPEAFRHLEGLAADQRLIMGVNEVSQGETPSGELSGAALALLDDKVRQQASTIQANFLRLLQQMGKGLLSRFNKRASIPRKIAIVGESSRYLVSEATFAQGSFDRIRTVIVELGNPMSQSPLGRYEMAKELAQMGIARTPEQIQQVITTGNLKPLTQSLQNQLTLIQAENQNLLKGLQQPVIALDDHMLHAREHAACLANPEARKDPAIVQAVLSHISQHEQLYYSVPPTTLMLVGQHPPPMPMGPPGAPPPGGPGGPPPGPPGGPPPGAGGPPPSPMGAPPGIGPSPSQPDLPSMPTNPGTGQQAMPTPPPTP